MVKIAGRSFLDWYGLVDLAKKYGWKPSGTKLYSWVDESGYKFLTASDKRANGKLKQIEEPDWDGSYFRPCGQYVTQKDAQNMALALRKALINRLSSDSSSDWMHGTDDMIVICLRGAFQLNEL